MERSIWAVSIATFVLRFATGLTGALLVFFLADLPAHGGPEVGPFVVAVLTALFFAAELVLSPPFGVLADRLGHHVVMQVGPLFGFVAVLLTALCAEIELPGSVVIAIPVLVGSLPLLGLTRLLEGASTAASVPSVLGFLAAVTSGDEGLRGRASARFEAATIAGLAMGFAAAGPVWVVLGPLGFVANALVYLIALALYRYTVPAASDIDPPRRRPMAWARYRRILGRPRVWLLAPTWIALNASLGLYTSQTLFQLIRTPDPRFAGQALVGGLSPLMVTLAFVLGGAVFFFGLWYWGGRFTALRRTTIIFYGIVGGAVLVVAALLLNHTGDAPLLLAHHVPARARGGHLPHRGRHAGRARPAGGHLRGLPARPRRDHGPLQRLPGPGPDHRRLRRRCRRRGLGLRRHPRGHARPARHRAAAAVAAAPLRDRRVRRAGRQAWP